MAVPFKQYCHQLIRAKNSGGLGLFWETLQILSLTPLNSPPNRVWETSAEIPCRWRVTAQIWVVPLIGWNKLSARETTNQNSSQIWVVTHRRNGISVDVSQTSFRGETSEGWRWEISAVFCSIETVIIPAIICLCLPTLPLKDSGTNYIFVFHIISIDNQSI